MNGTNTENIVLAVGAAGHFAGLVVPALASRGTHVRGLVLKPEEGEAVLRNGAAEIVVADLSDRASVDAALQGVGAAFYIGPQPHEDEAELGVNFVQACKDAGVRRVVFSSILHPTILATQNHVAKGRVEAAIVESGMEFTLLQPGMFYQNMTAAWPSILENGVLSEPTPITTRLVRVDYRDVAEVAAIALTEDRLRNGTFELCADGYFNREDVVSVISGVLGRPVKAAALSFDEWADQTKTPPSGRQVARAMFDYDGKYGSPGNSLTLRAILGREPRTLRQFFEDLVAGIPTVAS